MVQQWKTIRIFISSTFVDMHAERDNLSRDVYLRLKERCMKKHLHVQFVDLRWGISQEQAESGETIDILLDEIAKCDIFISLLGERYGSTPNIIPERILQENWAKGHSSSSFTALEILHKLHSKSSAKAFFYFRDPSFIAKIPETEKENYLPESPEAEQKLIALKESIRDSGYKVMENYPCDFDGKQIVGLEEFGNQVLEDLWDAISELYPEEEIEFDPISAEREMHDQFAHERSYLYVKRDMVEELDEYVQGNEAKPFVITGEPGCGKSAFLAEWYLENSESYEILAYFIGASPGSTDYRQLLRSMCEELKSRFSLQHDIAEGTEQLSGTLLSLLLEADRVCEKKIVLIIDALDQLEGNYGLGWLLNYRPVTIKMILSSLEGPYLDELKRFEEPVLELPVLGKDEQKQIIRAVLDEFKGDRCELTEEQLDDLLEHPGTGTPLYLRIALEELRLFGDYAGLSDRIRSLGTDVPEMLEQLLERLETEHGKELVEKTFALINCSRYGLSELELLELLKRVDEDKLPLLIWEKLRRNASFYLVQRGEYMGFFHKQLVEAVEKRYPDKKSRHLELALYFEESELSRKVDEYPYQFMLAGEHEKLKDALCDLELFYYAMGNKRVHELVYYWNLIKEEFDQFESYLKIINLKIKERDKFDIIFIFNSLARFFEVQGKYNIALMLYTENLKNQEKKFGEHHPEVTMSLNNIAGLLCKIDENDKALQLFQRVLEIEEDIFGKDDPLVASTLNNLALLLQQMGEYDKALPLYQRALEIEERFLDADNSHIAITLNNFALLLQHMGQFDKALSMFQRALEINENSVGKYHPELCFILTNLGKQFILLGDNEKALLPLERSLNIYIKFFGRQHPSVAVTLNELGEYFRQVDEYEKAKKLHEEALEINEKVFGKNHSRVASNLLYLARLSGEMAEYQIAVPLYERALKINEQKLGDNHPTVASIIESQAVNYVLNGEYQKALPLYERALQINENVFGQDHPNVAGSLSNLGKLFMRQGNYDKAVQFIGRSLEINEITLGVNHPNVAISLNKLADVFLLMGDYEQALPLLKRSLDIKKKVFGENHSEVSLALNSLAMLFECMGEYEKSLVFCKQALDINEEIFGHNHPKVAISLENIAGVYMYMQKYDDAYPLLERALKINDKALGQDHPEIMRTLHNFAELLRGMEEYSKALLFYKDALEIGINIFGRNHPDVLSVQSSLASCYVSLGEYSKALPLFQYCLKTQEEIFDKKHPNVAITLTNIAELFIFMKEYDTSLLLSERAYEIFNEALGPNHPRTITALENITYLLTETEE